MFKKSQPLFLAVWKASLNSLFAYIETELKEATLLQHNYATSVFEGCHCGHEHYTTIHVVWRIVPLPVYLRICMMKFILHTTV